MILENAKIKKIFVLDTNVILHDSSCIYQFHEHDVVIPITVLEELDNFKKGNDTINFHARKFIRDLDCLSGEKLFNGGVALGPHLGKLFIKLEEHLHEDLLSKFFAKSPDNHILNTAYILSKKFPDQTVMLITKDVNLRMKAKSVGIMAQDYQTDHVKDISALYTGHRIVEDAPIDLVDQLYRVPYEFPSSLLPVKIPFSPNEFFILKNQSKSVLATFNPYSEMVQKVDKSSAYNINPRNAEQAFALNALLNPEILLVTMTGKAGTGKTLLALATALEKIKQYHQIYIARPIVPLSNKDVGFLPGDVQSKLTPYIQPLYDNLAVIQNQFPESNAKNRKIKELLEEEKLVIAPLCYIRGRSLVKVFFIVDEAQNLTPHEIKTIITRAGDGTKIVFTGDIFQIDHPYLNTHSNGLSYLIDKMNGQKIYAHINLEKGERSELAELASNLL